jgi:type IV pilus assembly protein PilV
MQKLPNKQRGFSLIEAMVSLVVIGVGLLGLGGMQVASVKGTNNAHARTVATLLAMDLGDRMRANKTALDAGKYDTATAQAAAAVDCGVVNTNCRTVACSPAKTALYDLEEVMCGATGSISKALLNSSLSVTCPGAAVGAGCGEDSVHIIEIKWFASNIHEKLDTTKLKANDTQEFTLRHEIVSPP